MDSIISKNLKNKLNNIINKNIFSSLVLTNINNKSNIKNSNTSSSSITLQNRQLHHNIHNTSSKNQFLKNLSTSSTSNSLSLLINQHPNENVFHSTFHTISTTTKLISKKNYSTSSTTTQSQQPLFLTNNIEVKNLQTNIYKKNAMTSSTSTTYSKNSQFNGFRGSTHLTNQHSNFHTSSVLHENYEDLPTEVPKFKDSREKKEFIKLAQKRNDIAIRGRMEGSYHWALSKVVIAGIVVCTFASAIVGRNMLIDVALGLLLPFHVYYTVEDLIFDYLPSRKYPKINKLLVWILRLITAISLFSMFKFNTNDIGISDAVKMVWQESKIHAKDEEIEDSEIYY